MTSAMETMDTTEPPDAATPSSRLTDLAVRGHLVIASLFLLAGLGLIGLAAAKLVEPGFLDGSAMLTYGRVRPMGLSALVFGWLSVGLIGVAYHVVPRAVGAPLAFPLIAAGNMLLMAAAVAGGIVGIALGRVGGPGLSAFPLEADGALLLSLFTSAAILTLTARRGDRSALPLSAWYLVAAAWWLVGAYAIGAMPDLVGIPGEIQIAMSSSAIMGLWIVSAGIGAGYHLVSRRVPDAVFNDDLGRIGFYSIAFTWVWTVGGSFQYGPTNDWFETIPVVFGIGLVVGAIAVIADFALALRGKWDTVRNDAPLFVFTLGTILFALVPVLMLTQSFRSVSGVVRFTRFESALEIVGVVGAFSLWLMALTIHVLSPGEGGVRAPRFGRLVGITVVVGVAVAAGSLMIGGFQQGLAWLATVQDRQIPVGDGFWPSSAGLGGIDRAYLAGLAVLAVAALGFALWLVVNVVGSPRRGTADRGAPLLTDRLRTVGRATVLLFAVGALGAFVLPAMDADAEPSLLAERSRNFEAGSLADRGRSVFITEGCMYCHTQQVRAIVTDVGLGTVSDLGDYAFDPVGTVGYQRLGPDLAHAGSRQPTDSSQWVRDHLVDPRAARPWSIMPSYRYLSDDDLTALAVYVAGLE